jgi:hypothetical protein
MRRDVLAMLLIGSLAAGARAQGVSAGAAPVRRLPSLDELLGIAAPGSLTTAGDTPVLPDADREALDRQLSAEDAAQAFERAVQLMDQTAGRIGDGRDPGLVTQRLQEDVVRMLDAVIAASTQNQSSSSSSSSSSSEQEQQDQPNQKQNQQQQQEQARQDQQQGDPKDGQPPGRQDGALNSVQLNAAAWGSLPERLRDALVQGSSDRFSSIYQTMTEQYYRRLAEEKRP